MTGCVKGGEVSIVYAIFFQFRVLRCLVSSSQVQQNHVSRNGLGFETYDSLPSPRTYLQLGFQKRKEVRRKSTSMEKEQSYSIAM